MSVLLYQKIVNQDKYLKSIMGYGANCAGDSLDIWWKLKNNNPIRVKGKRNLEREVDLQENTNKNYHFWVESKGLVFEDHGGVRQIYKIEDFYKIHNISHIEKATHKCFFVEELPENMKDLVFVFNDLQLLFLIQTYKNKNEKQNKK
jgi:hypothetical protein